MGFILIMIGQGLKRIYLLSAVSILIGSVLTFTHTGGHLGHGIYYGLVGLALLLSGSLTLRSYLKHYPLVEEVEL